MVHKFSAFGPQDALTHSGKCEGWQRWRSFPKRESRMSFGIYLAGFLLLIAGLIYGAVILHISTQWIVVGAMVLVGLGVLSGVKATKSRDPS
jgi:hypothetical protein